MKHTIKCKDVGIQQKNVKMLVFNKKNIESVVSKNKTSKFMVLKNGTSKIRDTKKGNVEIIITILLEKLFVFHVSAKFYSALYKRWPTCPAADRKRGPSYRRQKC